MPIASKIYSFTNLESAYREVIRSSLFSMAELQAFEENFDENIITIHNHLVWGSYRIEMYGSASIQDAIVKIAFYRILNILLGTSIVCPALACRKAYKELGQSPLTYIAYKIIALDFMRATGGAA